MNKKGFSLIELLVSIILVSIILISLIASLVRIRKTYSVIHENADVLVYSRAISRVINNDLNKNLGINYINCDSYGTRCEIILGNDENRDLIIEEVPSVKEENGLEKSNIKTTLKYIDTTKGNNQLIYIKTLELNKYENKETGKLTTEGYNFLNIVLDTREYEKEDLVDVVTSIKINIYDGINESNSEDYDVTIYSSNRYSIGEVKGKSFRIAFNNMGADQAGTMSIDEVYGVGFYKSSSAHNKEDIINEIEIPVKIGYYFEGYFLKDETTTEKMVIDENGKIVADNKMFKRNISNRLEIPYVYAKWKIMNVNVTFDPLGGTLNEEEKTKTLVYNSVYGSMPIPEYKGHIYLGWFTSESEEVKSSTVVTRTKDHTLYAHWKLNTYSCNAGEYLAKDSIECSPCPTGSYCPVAGEYPYDPDDDQGNTKCPGNMTSDLGQSNIIGCKITCEAGKYLKANMGTCSSCPAGSYCPGRTCNYSTDVTCGSTKCAIGSYSSEGKSVCTGCDGGKTTSGTGKSTCDRNCDPIPNLLAWKTTVWNNNNTVSNLCLLNTCVSGYEASNNTCNPSTFTVQYNANGGKGTTSSHTCSVNGNCTLSNNGFTRSGYRFEGWKLNNTGTVLKPGSSIKNVVSAGGVATYYAHWDNSKINCVVQACQPKGGTINSGGFGGGQCCLNGGGCYSYSCPQNDKYEGTIWRKKPAGSTYCVHLCVIKDQINCPSGYERYYGSQYEDCPK